MRKVLNANEPSTFSANNDAETGLLAAHATEQKGAAAIAYDKHRKKEVRSQVTKLSFMIAMTFCVFLVELFYGYVSNSVALIADSFHMLSDVLALTVALACIMIAKRKSKSNTFGWVRAEVVGALVNGVFLLALCFSIFIESIERLLEPHVLKEPLNVLIVGVIGLLVNLVGMFLFHGHSHGHHHNAGDATPVEGLEETSYLATSHQDGAMAFADLRSTDGGQENGKSQARGDAAATSTSAAPNATKKSAKSSSHLNMKGVYLHIVTDFIGSVIVILTAGTSYWYPDLYLFKLYMDPVLSMLMVVLIMSSTIPLVRETALILLQTTPSDVDLKAIEQSLMTTPGVLAVHEFHVWRLVGMKIIATVHIRFASLDNYFASAERIREIFHDHSIHSVTVQPELSGGSGDLQCALTCKPEDCKEATCCEPKWGGGVDAAGDKPKAPV